MHQPSQLPPGENPTNQSISGRSSRGNNSARSFQGDICERNDKNFEGVSDQPLDGNPSLFQLDDDLGLLSLLGPKRVHNMCKSDHRLDSGMIAGSVILRMSTAGIAGQFRIVSEDILILSQSPSSDVADLQDHYRDMQLDVDNMSYEELLALEDHIGNVSTGLSEELIIKYLKLQRYFLFTEENSLKESCIICQEEYVEEDELGVLDCGHDFHTACIKQWLRCKNLCPTCKSTGLTTLNLNMPSNS